MEKGYQIIEPPALGELLAAPGSFDVTLAVLSWLVELLRAELKEALGGAEVEIIRAEYHGPYPAIGIHYDSDEREDLGPLVEATVARLLQERSVLDFINYVGRAGTDWRGATDSIVGPRSLGRALRGGARALGTPAA